MTSPMTLVVRMRRDTDGPNKLPGKSRLTLFRSNVGMSSPEVVALGPRGGRRVLNAPEMGGATLGRRHVVPVCIQRNPQPRSPRYALRPLRLPPTPLSRYSVYGLVVVTFCVVVQRVRSRCVVVRLVARSFFSNVDLFVISEETFRDKNENSNC